MSSFRHSGFRCLLLAATVAGVFSAPLASAQTLPVTHLRQRHMTLGFLDTYFDADHVKIIAHDIVFIWGKEAADTFLFSPSKKLMFKSNKASWNKIGWVTMTGDSGVECSRCPLRKRAAPGHYCGVETVDFDVFVGRSKRSGRLPAIPQKCAELRAYNCVNAPKGAGDVVSTAFGMPKSGLMPLNLRLLYDPHLESGFFQTKSSESGAKRSIVDRLATTSIAHETVGKDFFTVPRGFKVVGTDREIFGATDAAVLIEDLFVPGTQK